MNCQQHYRIFLYKQDHRCATSMRERRLSFTSSGSIWNINSQTDGLAMAVKKIGHLRHRISTHYITMCGVTWKLWCTHSRWTRELLQWILNAARSNNNAAVLRKVTSSVVTRIIKCIQADGGHFEQFAWVLNGQSVTVHLKTYLNKCTMHFFTFWFI